MEFNLENFLKLKKALTRIADTKDECHVGTMGPWQDVAFFTLFNRQMTENEYHQGLYQNSDEEK